MTQSAYRLSSDVLPKSYHITLRARPENNGFDGHVAMTLHVEKPTQTLVLHGRGLIVTRSVFEQPGQTQKVAVRNTRYDSEHDTIVFDFETALSVGVLSLSLDYTGVLSEGMHGLYRVSDGAQEAWVSQCEATDARAIFPCMDEPSFKATLQWTVEVPSGWTAIANGPLLSSSYDVSDHNTWVYRFKQTQPISTYLAALTMGRYECSETYEVSGIPCRIVTGVGKLNQIDFARNVTRFVIPWYEAYFGVKYPFDKLDQVAVPGFDAGAMENVGAIFYRQNLLLMQEGTATLQSQKRIAEVIAHEIAHQWFGNLVTMQWWDDLWLNEAFATWIAFKVCHAWKPKFRMWDDFFEHQEQALAADALQNTHAVYTDVASPAQATELFDVITYEKGCAVLRMLENYLGEKVFQQGIRLYMQRHGWGNARGKDLWAALEDVSKQPVTALMHSWITQPGYPVLVSQFDKKGARTEVCLHQERFWADESMRDHALTISSKHTAWAIPISLRYDMGEGARVHKVLMQEASCVVPLPEEGEPLWVWINADATGFYRVHMDDTLRAKADKYAKQYLTPTEKMQDLSDMWALVRAGRMPVDALLESLLSYAGEHDYMVLRAIASRLNSLDSMFVTDNTKDVFASFVQRVLQPSAQALHWDVLGDVTDLEQAEYSAKRALLLQTLGDLGADASMRARARTVLHDEQMHPARSEPNVAAAAVSICALLGTQEQLNHFVSIFKTRQSQAMAPDLALRYLYALPNFSHNNLTASVLGLILNAEIPQDQVRVILGSLLGRRASQREAWLFLKKNFATLLPQVGAMGLSRLVESLGSLPYDLRSDIEEFLDTNPIPEAARARLKALELIDIRKQCVDREGARFMSFLNQCENKAVAAS